MFVVGYGTYVVVEMEFWVNVFCIVGLRKCADCM